MTEHAHFSSDQSGICAHCGQPLLSRPHEPRYMGKRANPLGIAITVLLHLLLVLVYAFWPKHEKAARHAAWHEAITYIAPLPGKPKKKELAAAALSKPVKKRPEVVLIERLPDTITLPTERRQPPPELSPCPNRRSTPRSTCPT
ncbi:hypothetical protein LP420_16845 [Massilia sp. B-10]|nr:hypothetical protein LP420_16845 [Massilia sp. B-10]